MKNIFYLTVVIICAGCSSPTNKTPKQPDTTKAVAPVVPPKIKTDSIGSQYAGAVKGVWADTSGEKAFKITASSIYYYRHSKGYKYTLKDDSLTIYYGDYTYAAKIYFTKDTLVMDSKDDGVAKFFKPKN